MLVPSQDADGAASHFRDALGRRSRFRRTPTGKRFILGARDTEILRWLCRYRYLTTNQLIAALRPKSEKRLAERLGDLFHETGIVGRLNVGAPALAALASPMLYELAAPGIAYLEYLGPLPHRAVTFSRRRHGAYQPQYHHTLLVIETLLGIEFALRKEKNQRFVPVDEILARAPEGTRRAKNPLAIPVTISPGPAFPGLRRTIETTIIPDALYGIEYRIDGEMRYRFFALECERTTPAWRGNIETSSIAKKCAAYDALIRSAAFKRHWGLPNLKLHSVTPSGASCD